MKPVREWFSLRRVYDADGYIEDEIPHWYNRCWEFGDNERWQVRVGDTAADDEHESGGHHGAEFAVNLVLFQEDMEMMFHNPGRRYDVHWFEVQVWRWGVFVAVRGKARPK